MHDEDIPDEATARQAMLRLLNLTQEEAMTLYLEWSKKSHWTLEEAAALMIGARPDALTPQLREYLPIDIAHKFETLCDLLRRKFGERVPPPELLDWAELIGEEIPAALISAIQSRTPGAKRTPRQSDEAKVKKTLLKIILGIAVDKYAFDPRRNHNATAKQISGKLEEMGLKVSQDTVRDYLTEAAENSDDVIMRWLSSR